jgi:hypothetical protein
VTSSFLVRILPQCKKKGAEFPCNIPAKYFPMDTTTTTITTTLVLDFSFFFKFFLANKKRKPSITQTPIGYYYMTWRQVFCLFLPFYFGS